VKFEAAQVEIAEMVKKAKAQEITLAYVDEAGFSAVHPVTYAWTPIGSDERHLIDGNRGNRLNVMGALFSCGKVIAATYWKTSTADVFAGFLAKLVNDIKKPMTVILDNASIHKAARIRPLIKELAQRGLTLYFLPPYSPELNRIERFWHQMKHTWLKPKRRDRETMQTDVDEILDNIGTKYVF
jgi:transposase